MKVEVWLPTVLRSHVAGKSRIAAQGSNVGQVLNSLVDLHPALRPYLFDDRGKLHAYINVFLNDSNIRSSQGLDTKVVEIDELRILPAVAGG
ncbi:MAG: molybdopterin synthase sulfur carrier subunit [Acidimicrobiaceae bacterium]|nr:molybdopterin synthase sulfur carrier subunit [Acidimicrobiaceae bacterium]